MSDSRLDAVDVLAAIANTLETRLPQNGGDPQSSYAAKLYAKGPDAFLKKIAEESGEVLLAAKDGDTTHLIAETADLWFHSLVMLTWYGIRPERVITELARRQGLSGLAEKAARSEQNQSAPVQTSVIADAQPPLSDSRATGPASSPVSKVSPHSSLGSLPNV